MSNILSCMDVKTLLFFHTMHKPLTSSKGWEKIRYLDEIIQWKVTWWKASYIDLCLKPSYIATLGKEMRKKNNITRRKKKELRLYLIHLHVEYLGTLKSKWTKAKS